MSGEAFDQSSDRLQKKIQSTFIAAGYDKVDFVFPTAPHALSIPDKKSGNLKPNARAWYYYDATRPEHFETAFKSDDADYLGLEKTVSQIQSLSDKPFDAVIGFSQGACLASLLCARASAAVISSVPSCLTQLKAAIFISGFARPLPKSDLSHYSTKVGALNPQFDTLHVYGLSDDHIPKEKSEELAAMYGNSRIHVHSGGHIIPQKAADVTVIAEFLVRAMQQRRTKEMVDISNPNPARPRVNSPKAKESAAAAIAGSVSSEPTTVSNPTAAQPTQSPDQAHKTNEGDYDADK